MGCYPSSFSLLIESLIGNSNFEIRNVSKEIYETGVDIDSSCELIFESGFKSKIYSSFKNNLGSQSVINGEKGSITIKDTWLGVNSEIKVKSDKNYSIKFDKDKNIYSYQIQIISTCMIIFINPSIQL